MTAFFKKLAIFVFIIGLLKPAGGIGMDEYAYAIRYELEKNESGIFNTATLDQISILNDKIKHSQRVDLGYNSFTVLDRNRLIMCDNGYREGEGKVDIFDFAKNKVTKTLCLTGKYPKAAVLAKDKIIIVSQKNRYVDIGIAGHKDVRIFFQPCFEIFDRNTFLKIGEIDLRDGDNVEERMGLGCDKTKLFFITWNALGSGEEYGLLGKIDLQAGILLKQIGYQPFFGAGKWVAVSTNNKLYLSAVYTLPMKQKNGETKPELNNQLFVLDASDLSFIKTISIGVLAEQLTYVSDINRLYIAHASWDERTPQYIEVLDCATDKIIKKIPVKGFRRMSYVGNHKLYVTHSGGPLFGSDGSGGILVIDVKSNKVIKKIPGEYAPVSYNFEPVD
ncbi:MAG: hypothetical protein WC890_05990 [Candidatus Margulisiibacteriota bacterium]